MTLTRLESFPFDSRYDGYDDEGYPVYDRAVGAKTMRGVFAHFFSDGVFSDTTYPFRLTKAASGLAVTVNPGVIIINGGWGILPEATTLTFATGTTAGVIKYAVFARYDNNDEHRTLYLRTDASSAGGAVPEPVTTEANVVEYRIGYITVPSNASDLSGATVINEVGTSMCPYAVPLFDINPAEVLEDLKQDAQAAYDTYYALLASSIDDTTAGNLQNQISENASRIATLEENQFTQESIDAQALRAEMGLGNTTGVLGIPYGGTGLTSLDGLLDLLFEDEVVLANVANNSPTGALPSTPLKRGVYFFSLECTYTSAASDTWGVELSIQSSGFNSLICLLGPGISTPLNVDLIVTPGGTPKRYFFLMVNEDCTAQNSSYGGGSGNCWYIGRSATSDYKVSCKLSYRRLKFNL